jgi:acyl dehydratase
MDGVARMSAECHGLRNPPAHLTRRSLHLTSERIRRYGFLTEDPNPIHYDPAFAAGTSFGKPIAQGTLTLNALWAAVTASFGTDALSGMVADLRFIKPVTENDTVTATGELTSRQPPTYRVAILDSNGAPVVEGSLSWPAVEQVR